MKVKKIEIFDCELTRRDPTMKGFNPILIRVHTDEDISGIGEVGLAFGTGAKAAVGMLRDLSSLVLGEDPMRVEAIWERLFRSTYWGISAYDIAFWDIRGKKQCSHQSATRRQDER
jgi:galactonate dehydratase